MNKDREDLIIEAQAIFVSFVYAFCVLFQGASTFGAVGKDAKIWLTTFKEIRDDEEKHDDN